MQTNHLRFIAKLVLHRTPHLPDECSAHCMGSPPILSTRPESRVALSAERCPQFSTRGGCARAANSHGTQRMCAPRDATDPRAVLGANPLATVEQGNVTNRPPVSLSDSTINRSDVSSVTPMEQCVDSYHRIQHSQVLGVSRGSFPMNGTNPLNCTRFTAPLRQTRLQVHM